MIEKFARAGGKAWSDAAQGQDLLNLGITNDRLETGADVYQPVGGLPVKTAN
jgi:hypothetical protein